MGQFKHTKAQAKRESAHVIGSYGLTGIAMYQRTDFRLGSSERIITTGKLLPGSEVCNRTLRSTRIFRGDNGSTYRIYSDWSAVICG
jgi:hypothetical protein